MKKKLITTNTHIDDIKVGDTVQHNGKVVTVGKKDIKDGGFMGRAIFGDSYRLGSKKVLVVDPQSINN